MALQKHIESNIIAKGFVPMQMLDTFTRRAVNAQHFLFMNFFTDLFFFKTKEFLQVTYVQCMF